MESCLERWFWKPGRQAFRIRKRAVGSQWDHLGENIVLGGPDWRQTGVYSQPPGGQKTNSRLIDGVQLGGNLSELPQLVSFPLIIRLMLQHFLFEISALSGKFSPARDFFSPTHELALVGCSHTLLVLGSGWWVRRRTGNLECHLCPTQCGATGESFGWLPVSLSAQDRKSTRLNSSHSRASRMPSSA